MSMLDESNGQNPTKDKVKSKPLISESVDRTADRKLNHSSNSQPEKSLYRGPISQDKGKIDELKAVKRKQSKIKLDSDESEDEPLIKKPNALGSNGAAETDQDETLLKFSTPRTTLKDSDKKETSLGRSNGNGSKSNGHGDSITAQPDSAVLPKDESDSDVPLIKSEVRKAGKSEYKTSSKALPKAKKQVPAQEESSSDDEALRTKTKEKKPGKSAVSSKKQSRRQSSEESDASSEDKPLRKRPKKTKNEVAKVEAKDTAAIARKIDGKKTKATIKKEGDDEDEDEEYRWWEQEKEDDSVKWKSLEHNGVVFPDPYQRLPKDVKMKYNGRPLTLSAEAEEVAGFFGALIETDHAANPTFVKNFFEDFRKVCQDSNMKEEDIPKDFKKCDFRPMFEYFEAKKEEKKSMSKEEKKRLKEEKDALEEKYKEAIVDGRKEKIGNFRIEPPGLFRGRGAHPKTGRLKTRVMPEQVTINIGENVPVPAPPEGHKWAEVRHDNTVTWLATWNENINNNVKYVMMAAGSSFKGQSDLKKFEKARTLKGCIRDIRKKYEAELTDKVMETRQRATAMYFIDKFALRAGNEKGEDEADTVGCCSLRLEHVSLKEPQIVIFDFLGKDSIRYYNEVSVDKRVFKNLMIFKKGKKLEDMIFDRLNTGKLNKHLTELMPGLSAKVFRTYNASFTFQQQLEQTDANASVADKVLAYNRANREVAVLCNHQRTVSKTHDAAMEKIEDKVREQKYQKMRLQRMMVNLEPKLAKKRPELLEYESEIDDEWIAEHHDALYARELEKIRKKFERENEKRISNKETALPKSELDERLKAAEELAVMLKQEKKTGKVEAKSSQTIEKLQAQIEKQAERIAITKTQMIDKDENKTTALGTSKINYIDPRLTFAWCAKYSVPIEKMFTKTLREKFKWAAETPADWIF